jgi:hypothetical protein
MVEKQIVPEQFLCVVRLSDLIGCGQEIPREWDKN